MGKNPTRAAPVLRGGADCFLSTEDKLWGQFSTRSGGSALWPALMQGHGPPKEAKHHRPL